MRQPELADTLELLGSEGAAPFYTGEIAAAVVDWLTERGGMLTMQDLAAYRVIEREPVRVSYRGREVVTNPPPSAGGILIAQALSLLDAGPSPPPLRNVIAAMEATQAARTSEFLEGLDDPEFAARFLQAGGARGPTGRLGSTTHVAVIDRDGRACSVTSSNGASSGVVVPGTGVHLNNMLGEQDLNPLGFHRHPPGRRLPSMMAPTAVLRDGRPELVLGSAGSNRIRSAILQTIVRVIDDGLRAAEAVRAPRVHYEDGVIYAEPGVDQAAIGASRTGSQRSAISICSSAACRPSSATATAASGVPAIRGAEGVRLSCRARSDERRAAIARGAAACGADLVCAAGRVRA